MMYTRASASDYDDWETVYENRGWGSKELIPLLRKAGGLILTSRYTTFSGFFLSGCRHARS
jgi:GMC oxidoreductase